MTAKRRPELSSPPKSPVPEGDGLYGVNDGSLWGVDDGSVYGGVEFAGEEDQG